MEFMKIKNFRFGSTSFVVYLSCIERHAHNVLSDLHESDGEQDIAYLTWRLSEIQTNLTRAKKALREIIETNDNKENEEC